MSQKTKESITFVWAIVISYLVSYAIVGLIITVVLFAGGVFNGTSK